MFMKDIHGYLHIAMLPVEETDRHLNNVDVKQKSQSQCCAESRESWIFKK